MMILRSRSWAPSNLVMWCTNERQYDRFRHIQALDIKPFAFTLARDVKLEPKTFLIDGFVSAGETSAWYGPPDAGKSTAVLDVGCHIAAGLVYCGRRVMQGAVLYLSISAVL